MSVDREEPSDFHGYGLVSFNRDTLEFYSAAVAFYKSLLTEGLKLITSDDDLKTILGEDALATFPIAKELERTERARKQFESLLASGESKQPDFDLPISHGWVRYVKSVSILYLEHLRAKRDEVSTRSNFPKGLLQAIDQRLAKFEEKTQIGVFRNATPKPLILAELPKIHEEAPKVAEVAVEVRERRPQPVVLDSIEIRDTELRKRCLDLLAMFREEGSHERLDTVVNEATRILEDRLRLLSGAPATCTGVDLAKHAFAVSSPRLKVSDIAAEQESAHLLYRGLFGFIRNSVHHRLVANLQPERVLQIVGMIDYFIYVAEGAHRTAPPNEPDPGHMRG